MALAFVEIQDNTNPNLRWLGRARYLTDLPSEPVWQITRYLVEGSITYTQTLGDGDFAYVWDDRATYTFPDITPDFDQALSIEFDRTDDYMNGDLHATFEITRTTQWSLSMWVRFTNPGQAEILASQMDVSTEDPGWIFYKDGSNFLNFFIQNDVINNRIAIRATSGAIADTNWHHVCITVDGSSTAAGCAMYVDADPVTIAIDADNLSLPITNTADLQLGRYDTFYFGGNMDEVSFWDVDLTAQQVLSIYDGAEGIDLRTLNFFNNCVVWLRMGDGVDDVFPTIVDVVGGLEMTMNNMTSGDIEANVP